MYVYVFNTFRFRIINLKRFQLGTKDLSLKDRFGVRNSHRFVLKTDNKFEKNQWAGFFNDCSEHWINRVRNELKIREIFY